MFYRYLNYKWKRRIDGSNFIERVSLLLSNMDQHSKWTRIVGTLGNAIGGFVRGLDELDRFLNFLLIL